MRNTPLIIVSVFLVLVLISCSSSKNNLSWSTQDISSFENKKVLIVARTDDKSVQKEYENAIANSLRNKNINAVVIYEYFPNLKEINNPTSQEIKTILTKLETEDFDAIV